MNVFNPAYYLQTVLKHSLSGAMEALEATKCCIAEALSHVEQILTKHETKKSLRKEMN